MWRRSCGGEVLQSFPLRRCSRNLAASESFETDLVNSTKRYFFSTGRMYETVQPSFVDNSAKGFIESRILRSARPNLEKFGSPTAAFRAARGSREALVENGPYSAKRTAS